MESDFKERALGAEKLVPTSRFGLKDRIWCIRSASQFTSIPEMQKAWRAKFNTEPPSRKTILNLNKKFNKTGNVADLVRTGRPKTVRTEEKVAQVEAAFAQDPSKSIRTVAHELGISKGVVHRIKTGYLSLALTIIMISQFSEFSEEFD